MITDVLNSIQELTSMYKDVRANLICATIHRTCVVNIPPALCKPCWEHPQVVGSSQAHVISLGVGKDEQMSGESEG